MPVVSTVKMTARQFLELGEDPPGVRLELVDGEVAVSPSPTPRHSYTDTALRTLLHGHVTNNDLGLVFGDVDTIFGVNDVRRPDLIYFSKSRLHLIGNKAMEGPPDLCVEIVSPSSTVIDRVDKFKQYQNAAVPHYWVLDPSERTMQGYTLRRGKYVIAGEASDNDIVRLPPFPDLDISLKTLWLPPIRRNGKR
jgi:Uma2 family endonuclease